VTPESYKAERIKRGLSQAALAALVGVSRGCINYREAGHDRYPITTESWLAICSLPQATKRRPRKGQNAKVSQPETKPTTQADQ
jgi:DNA-binding XRE family transcriptional regulator